MTVTRLKEEMTASEYLKWLAFYAQRQRQQEADNGNLLAMNPEDLVKRFGNGG